MPISFNGKQNAELFADGPRILAEFALGDIVCLREYCGLSNRYTRAARFLKEWRREGVLREDDHPALYVYHQTFEVEGKTRSQGTAA